MSQELTGQQLFVQACGLITICYGAYIIGYHVGGALADKLFEISHASDPVMFNAIQEPQHDNYIGG
jgi:hypothetical protein